MSALASLGKYDVRRQLGRGAMGTVYEGFDPIIERIVAIKTVHLPEVEDEETAEQIARFRREAQAAGRLTHPNIVGVFDYGETADLAYIVMEYVDGPPLKNLLDKNERFPLPRIAQIMEDLCAGLQFSHDRGVVHRDIKPANLMLTKGGQTKIADFGIARIESSSMTQAGTVLGTPAYMSPEQFMGQVVDSRTDIYSSGVLLYQLLTGERPFEGNMSSIMHKVLNTEAPLPSQLSVTAPRTFDAVVRKAMAKRPEDRFASAADFAAAIRAAMTAPAPAVDEAEDSGEATMIAAPRPAPTSPAPTRPAPAQPAPARPAAAGATEPRIDPLSTAMLPPANRRAATASAPAASPATAGAEKSSKLPIFIGSGVAGLAVLGGIGYFLLSGGSTPISEPAKPAVASNPPPTEGSGKLPTGSVQEARPTVTPPRVTTPPPTPSETTTPTTVTSGTTSSPTPPPATTGEQAVPSTTTVPPTTASTTTLPPTTVTTEPPPVQQQVALVQPPVVTQRPPPDPSEAIRSEIAAFASRLPCALLDGEVSNGAVQVTGIGGRPAIDSVRQKLTAMGLTRPPPALRITQVDPSFCQWEDLLRPFAKPFGDTGTRLSLHLADDPPFLETDDFIRPRLAMAGFRGDLHVDYLDRDGHVLHLYPQPPDPKNRVAGDPPHTFNPGETLALGDKVGNKPFWQVDAPYGTDLIIAVASEDALFSRPRTGNPESAVVYLRDLQKALDVARARGTRIVATAIPVETRKKQ